MNRWRLVIGLFFITAGLYDLFGRAWIGGGAYFSFGVSYLLGVEKPGPRKILSIIFSIVAMALLTLKLVRGWH